MVLLPRGARLLAAVVALGASAGCVVPGRRPMVVRPELPARPARIQEVTVRVAEYGWQLPGATPFEKARIDGLRKKRHRYLVQALEQAGFRIADGGPTEGVVLDVVRAVAPVVESADHGVVRQERLAERARKEAALNRWEGEGGRPVEDPSSS